MNSSHRLAVPPLFAVLALVIQACQPHEPSPAPESGRPQTGGAQWSIKDPAPEPPPPYTGSRRFRAGIAWKTDDVDRLPCRFWVDLSWDPRAGVYLSNSRLALPPNRPTKMELLFDVRPWLVGNEVKALVQPLPSDFVSGTAESAALGSGELFPRAGRDYLNGPHVAVSLRRGTTDLMDKNRSRQNLRVTVYDPERKQALFVAILRLFETGVETVPGCE